MATRGKLVREVEVKCDCHLVYELYKHNPNDSAVIAPDKVQRCELLSGQWGTPGSVILWHFMHDGKMETAKEIVEEVDDESHKIVFRVIEGRVLELYNPLILTLNVKDTSYKKSVIWTVEFEKVHASLADPTPYLDLLCAVAGDMDAHFLKQL